MCPRRSKIKVLLSSVSTLLSPTVAIPETYTNVAQWNVGKAVLHKRSCIHFSGMLKINQKEHTKYLL